MYSFKKENSWRKLQSEYIQQQRKETFLKKSSRFAIFLCVTAVLVAGGVYIAKQISGLNKTNVFSDSQPPAETVATPPRLQKQAVRALVRDIPVLNAIKDHFFTDTPSQTHTIRTQLDTRLQESLIPVLDRLKTLTRGKPQRIAMVAMDGKTGFIKAMAGFDLDNEKANPCVAADYPAASIFKIVTAAAAVDAKGYTPQTPLYFNGNKYTLYKRQITDKKNKYTSRVSLASAFADSINPVFGKLGQLYLGRDILNTYAHNFGFNQGPETDFDFPQAAFAVTESDYHLAELGCGFNRDTLISPIFGATMVTAVVNQGNILVPRLVDQIVTPEDDLVYKSKKEIYKTAIRPESAEAMSQIMKKTISRGTARKAFRGYSRDKVLSTLIIGGKTGSLYNRQRTVKYDWFTGFGKQKNGGKTLVVAVVVGHRKYIGTRASTHARNMLKTYFTPVAPSKK